MPTQDTQRKPLSDIDKARAIVALSLMGADKLNDTFLPVDEYEIFKTKPYREWPKEMQEKLAPFGARMIG